MEKGSVGDPISHSYDARIGLTNNKDGLLPGMVCNVDIYPQDHNKQVVIPVRIIQRASNGNIFVWKMQGDSAVRQSIKTGALYGNQIEVLDGLNVGDEVIVDGYQKIDEQSKLLR